MNKLLVLVAVLALFCGTAFAGNLNDLQTAELAAETTGRSIVSDSSVVMKIWNTNANSTPAYVTVSNNYSIALIEGATQMSGATRFGTDLGYIDNGSYAGIILTAATADTVGEVVSIINNDTSGYWKASVGNDAYKAMPSRWLLPQTQTAVTTSKDTTDEINYDASTSKNLTCGVAAKDNTVNRIKSITHRVAGTGTLTIAVYDGDTIIWRKDIARASYNSATSVGASPDTINFAEITAGKGIASSKGNSLVVSATCVTTFGDTATAQKLSDANISITYDQAVK